MPFSDRKPHALSLQSAGKAFTSPTGTGLQGRRGPACRLTIWSET